MGCKGVICALGLAIGGCYQGAPAGDGVDTEDGTLSTGDATGSVESGQSEGSDGGEVTPSGTTVLRRLSAVEYRNTVADLLGVDIGDPPGDEETPLHFDNSSETFTMSDTIVEEYLRAAEALADAVDLAALLACDPASESESACLDALLLDLGRRAFRRPLAPDELSDYRDTFEALRADNDYDQTMRTLLTRMLVSPHFTYHAEVGAENENENENEYVTDFELASRLSYLVWESMPDDALLDAAEAGEIRGRIDTHVDRMLADPRARAAMWRFHRQWLRLSAIETLYKSEETYPGVGAIVGDLETSMRMFVESVVFDDAGDLEALLTSPHAFVNDAIAHLYGVTVDGPEHQRVDLPSEQRRGVLTQPALMAVLGKADKSAPILRGVFVRDRVLCSPLPPPPPGAAEIPDEMGEPTTTRAFFEELTSPASCQACHAAINPLGFTFEHYDAMGRYRVQDNGLPIDATGTVKFGDIEGDLEDAVELAAHLADSETVADCYARQWFRYGFSRHETGGDEDVVSEILSAFEGEERRLDALPRIIATSPAFERMHFQTTTPQEDGG